MFASANPVAQAQVPMVVTVPPGASGGQLIQLDANGTMMQVQVPVGLSQGQQFQVMVPAPQQAQVAVPVQPQVVQANPVRLGDNGGGDVGEAYVVPGGDDPIVQAKVRDARTKNTPCSAACVYIIAQAGQGWLG